MMRDITVGGLGRLEWVKARMGEKSAGWSTSMCPDTAGTTWGWRSAHHMETVRGAGSEGMPETGTLWVVDWKPVRTGTD